MSTCFSLTGSTACGELGAQMIAASGPIQNASTVDTYVATLLGTEHFATTYGCSGYTGHFVRYQQSLICNYLVAVSAAACAALSTAPYQPLCAASCAANAASVNALFGDAAVCPASSSSAASLQERSAFNATQLLTCQDAFATNDPATCWQGLSVETQFVGFRYAADAASFCGASCLDAADAALCAKFLSNSSLVPSFVPASTANSTATPATSASQLLPVPFAQLTNAQKLSLITPARTLPYIASGIAWGVMVLFGILWGVVLKLQRWNNHITIAFRPEPLQGRATLRRQNQGGNRPKRQSIFSSIFGGSVYADTDINGDATDVSKNPTQSQSRTALRYQRQRAKKAGRHTEAAAKTSSIRQSIYSIFGKSSSNSYQNFEDDTITLEAPAAPFPPPVGSGANKLKMKVITPFTGVEYDEMTVKIGDVLIIKETFSDGWCLAKQAATGMVGIVPLVCLDSIGSNKKMKAQTRPPARRESRQVFGR
ncbi:hypothetical protein HK100_001419 [Physocladia obscura]|uniref:SH3 domain-containing protein n=1 Tax=Physocladia obscura TaxID=109957 RepID=A0AAD5SWU9_9FUNG|nr:hypothetical protein HK100_001419 [Physocladia obscura]